MINLMQSKVLFGVLFLALGYGIGVVKPVKFQFLEPAIDSYGVPKISNYHHPEVDGVKMTPMQFIVKYCKFSKSDTCDFVVRATHIKE
jgi:hypothetical protein